MDDIYEFDNSKYRLASMQMKAIAYDIVTEIARKKLALKKGNLQSEEQEQLLNQLTTISDNIIDLTDTLEHQLQQLDEMPEDLEEQEIQKPKQEKQISEPVKSTETTPAIPKSSLPPITPVAEKTIPTPEPIKEEKKVVEESVSSSIPTTEVPKKEELPSIKPIVKEEKIEETPKEKETQKEEEAPAIDLPKIEIPEPNLEPVEETKEEPQLEIQPVMKEEEPVPQPEPPTEEEPQEEKEPSVTEEPQMASALSAPTSDEAPAGQKRFQKTTKEVSKAIMVRPNQLENLRKSRIHQEQILAVKGLLPEVTEQEQEEEIKQQVPKELPDDVERKIEDLTVKASIYYNEGELDKAQELYDEIKELNKQYQ